MAAPHDGIAYIDLSGNRIYWTSHEHHSRILLDGSHFHDVVPMTSLVISCLCGLALLYTTPAIARFDRQNTDQSPKKKKKKTLMSAILCMIGFFAFDIANRVEHERELIVPPTYIAIDIPLGSLSSIADGILQIWLLNASPVDVQGGPALAKAAMTAAIVIYWIVSFVCKGTQIWAILQQMSPNFINSLANGDKKTEEGLTLGFEIYQYLNTAASGMIFLFAIGYAIFSFSFVRRRLNAQSDTQHKRLTVAIGILAVLFLARNAVMFTFTLLYAQLNHQAPPGIQLVYLAFYGILSVGVYICIRVVVRSRIDGDPLTHVHGLGQVQEQSPQGHEGWGGGKPQANVSTAPYMYQNSYGSYRYEPIQSTWSR